ncbi:cytochrome P450 71AP13-like [Prosopis cineraria]|uniref:cytochrome P450 71AP13-like n=1 Tax=Prosopis cineraria TaxID=364024 RepID=UPI00240FCA4F|nr:cytochrome P450 71AP13-like [Prosopis cineraria]
MAVSPWLRGGCQPLSLVAFIFLLVLIKLLLMQHKSRKQRSHLPPGPPAIPIIGNLHQLGTMPHLSLQRLAAKHGPLIYLQLGEIPTVVVSSARLAKEVMKTHDLALASRPQLFAAKHLFYNCTNIVFSPYGPYWRNIRKICILELLSAKRVETYRSVREEEVARLVSRIAESSPGTLDLTKLLGLYANDVLCRTVFGRDFSKGGDYHRHGFQKMLEEYQVLLGGFSIGEFFPSLEFMHSLTGMKSRLKDTFRRFDQLFDQILKEHSSSNEIEDHDKDLVDVLLEVQRNDSDEMPLTTDNIKAIILDMFAAGTDTTFITLDWAMTELVMNPWAMEKAQNEVRGVLGERRIVLESDLPHLHYMKAIIKEIFRFHSPVPVLVPRESIEDVVIDGYKIPARTRVYVNAWAIGRDKESWEDPERFKPEKFLGSDIDFKGQDFELIPFGAGRRGCPAITFATAIIELALAQLLHSFDWELPPGISAKDLDLTEVFGISMHRRDHLYVVAKRHFP